jgi:hypothetical protein
MFKPLRDLFGSLMPPARRRVFLFALLCSGAASAQTPSDGGWSALTKGRIVLLRHRHPGPLMRTRPADGHHASGEDHGADRCGVGFGRAIDM